MHQPKEYPPVILVLNKVDLVEERAKVEELAKVFYKEYPFKKCFLVSALRGGGMQYLKEYLVRKVRNVVLILPAFRNFCFILGTCFAFAWRLARSH